MYNSRNCIVVSMNMWKPRRERVPGSSRGWEKKLVNFNFWKKNRRGCQCENRCARGSEESNYGNCTIYLETKQNEKILDQIVFLPSVRSGKIVLLHFQLELIKSVWMKQWRRRRRRRRNLRSQKTLTSKALPAICVDFLVFWKEEKNTQKSFEERRTYKRGCCASQT